MIFGDDEHTAADGPYARVLKTRKWLYASAALATAVSLHLYQPAAAADLLKVIHLPMDVVRTAAFGGLVYMLVQYGLLAEQLRVSYDLILAERLAFRKAAEEAKALERLREASEALAGYRDMRPPPDESRVRTYQDLLRKNLEGRAAIDDHEEGHFLKDLGLTKEAQINFADAQVETARQALNQAVHDYNAEAEIYAKTDPELTRMRNERSDAGHNVEAIQMSDPARRGSYRHVEVGVDILRVAVPAVVGLFALVNLTLSAL